MVQGNLIVTAGISYVVMRKTIKFIQGLSLLLLMTGVILCNLQNLLSQRDEDDDAQGVGSADAVKGISATIGIVLCSSFAGVYTEKILKTQRSTTGSTSKICYSLPYLQVQLAMMTLATTGAYAMVTEYSEIVELGLLHNFTYGAFLSTFSTATTGLTVAAGTLCFWSLRVRVTVNV